MASNRFSSSGIKESDDIIDDVGSFASDSIRESIEESGQLKTMMNQNSYEAFKANQFTKVLGTASAVTTMLTQVE